LKFYHWINKQYKSLNQKGLSLFPICKVERKHVRLDEKSLIYLVTQLMKSDEPIKEHYTDKKLFTIVKRKLKAEYEEKVKEFEKRFEMDKGMILSYDQVQKVNPKNPYKEIELVKPVRDDYLDTEKFSEAEKAFRAKKQPIATTKKKKKLSKEEKPPEKKDFTDNQKYQADLKAYEEQYQKIINDVMFLDRVRQYENYCIMKKILALLFFIPPNETKTKGVLKPSIATDGVAVSFMFEKDVVTKTKKASGKSKQSAPVDRIDVYDSEQSLVLEECIVLGIDPGRTTLVTVVVYDAANKKQHVWKLSRGQYHVDSGILKHNVNRNNRLKSLHNVFYSMGDLKSGNSIDVEKYLENYNKIKSEWWLKSLKKVESRAKIQSYIGKRKVIDSFFSNLIKDVKHLFGNKNLIVAYGSAGPSMCSTGKGELAVPTTGAYKSCKRICGAENVVLTDEDYTTKKCLCCQSTKLAVYRDENKQLFYSAIRPIVPEDKRDKIKAIIEEDKYKNLKRRGGQQSKVNKEGHKEGNKEEKKMQYPEVRGLRFCPKCRSYLDRDVASARTIGVLEVMKMLTNSRPSCFCRPLKDKNNSKEASSGISMSLVVRPKKEV
jgi:hypothetical protein